jgi:hypothetical protein
VLLARSNSALETNQKAPVGVFFCTKICGMCLLWTKLTLLSSDNKVSDIHHKEVELQREINKPFDLASLDKASEVNG